MTGKEPIIRLAEPDDIGSVRQVAEAAYLRYVPRIGRVPAPMAADFQAHVTANETWVTEVESAVAGYIIMFPKDNALFIENIAVEPAWAGQGMGRALMAVADDQAALMGAQRISLYTNVRMWENLDFYGKLGFKVDHFVTEAGFRRVYLFKELI